MSGYTNIRIGTEDFDRMVRTHYRVPEGFTFSGCLSFTRFTATGPLPERDDTEGYWFDAYHDVGEQARLVSLENERLAKENERLATRLRRFTLRAAACGLVLGYLVGGLL